MENGKDKKEEEVKVEETPAVESVDKEKEIVDDEKKNVKDAKSEEKKVEEATEASSELLEKLKKQVEFYFGDINMQRDKFLIEQTKLDEGWIPMAVMLNFNALASMSKDIPTILKALEDSELMEISEDKKKIRRRPDKPLPIYDENYRKSQAARTLYVKGFPLKTTDINKLKAFFNDYPAVENIIMRKYKDSDKNLQFKGSIFVQFKTVQDAKDFRDKESVKYEGEELIRIFSDDYAVMKEKEKEERKSKQGGKTKTSNKNVKADKEESSVALPKGAVLKFTGASDSTDWDAIKSTLINLDASIAYVDYKIGAPHGWIRLQNENGAKPLLEKMTDNKVTIDGSEVTFEVLEGEEEENYLKKAKNDMANRKLKTNRSKQARSKRGRGGYAGRKRQGSPVKNDTPAKKVATN